MHMMRCALHEDGLDDIILTWSRFYKFVMVEYKGQPVYIHNRLHLFSQSWPIELPDGTVIELHLRGSTPIVTKDGVPLPGSRGSDRYRIEQGMEWFHAFVFAFLGLGVFWYVTDFPEDQPKVSILWITTGLLFLVTALWTKLAKSMKPFLLGSIPCIGLGMASLWSLGFNPLLIIFYIGLFYVFLGFDAARRKHPLKVLEP